MLVILRKIYRLGGSAGSVVEYVNNNNNNNNNNLLLNVRFGSLLGLRGLLLIYI